MLLTLFPSRVIDSVVEVVNVAHCRIMVFHQPYLNPISYLDSTDCLDGCEFQLVESFPLVSPKHISFDRKCDGYFSKRSGFVTKDLIALSLPSSYRKHAGVYLYYLLRREIQLAQMDRLSASVIDVHI